MVQGEEHRRAAQNTDVDRFPVGRGENAHAQVVLVLAERGQDLAVLRQAFFRDIHVRHDLDAGDNSGMKPANGRRHRRLVQNAVDAVAHAQPVFKGLDVNVGGVRLNRLEYQFVDELDD